MANYVTVTSDKKRGTAYLLCLIGGLFGAHQFYVGRPLAGFLYACTAGCFFKAYWYDLGQIRRGKFQDNAGTYLRA